MTNKRILPFDAVDNFRDYGDYATQHGAHLARGVLYRSAHHARATDADRSRMGELGVAVIVDLRRRSERDREPSRRPALFQGDVIENDIGDVGVAPHLTFVMNNDLTPQNVRDFMIEEYRRIPFEPRHLDLYRRYFRALAEARGPVLIHCAAGKDRTGILAALTHHAVGVHPDDIAADYLLTNNPERMAARLPQITQSIEELSGKRPAPEAVMTVMGVDTVYLDNAFAAMDEHFGGVDAYLEHTLGVTPAVREALAERLLV